MSAFNQGSALVRWIEGHSFFGRPRYDKRQLTCQQLELLPDYSVRHSNCRVGAAGTCLTPDVGLTWTGDACVCSTLTAYAAKYASCWADTPYSRCYDIKFNNSVFASWSSGHCTRNTPKPSTPTPVDEKTTTPTPKSVPPPETPSPPAPAPQTPTPNQEPKPASTPQREDPKQSDPPKATDPPRMSTPDSKPSIVTSLSPTVVPGPEKTTETIPTSVPQPSLVSIVVAPRTSAEITGVSASITTSHIPLPKWTGGALLQGYCATPDYTIIDGPTAYWAPVVGCVGGKADCCPFDIPPTVALEVAAVETGSASAGGGERGFPSALSPVQATLSKCPDDYRSIGEGCCPSNYYPWSTAFGGQTPCYSTLRAAMTPPPVSGNIALDTSKPTSAIVNVVYAMQFPLKATPQKSGLATGAKIGIGVGAGVIAAIFGVLMFLLARKHKQHKKDKKALEEMSGIGSTRQSVAASSAFGGVKDWRKNVSDESSGLQPVLEPTLPRVVPPPQPYNADWRPSQQRTVSPPVPHPGYYSRSSLPSPPIQEAYSEVGSDSGFVSGPGGGYASGNRSELHSGDYGMPRPELQGGQGQWQHEQATHGQWAHEGVAQQVRYYEAPSGRMTPKMS
ncbi:hypothetical protein BKA66DRAFT_129997 [Pyrenochaeta sp. MPI-SDFR-AT-0127]|nr:hypothetical protein BKA66DRAFT_129997 [Pyrenochaeta sp. MPI-SDFR-AT-0127]